MSKCMEFFINPSIARITVTEVPIIEDPLYTYYDHTVSLLQIQQCVRKKWKCYIHESIYHFLLGYILYQPLVSYTSTYTLNSHCILWEALILNIIVERAPQFCSTYELNCGSFYCCAHNSNKNCSKKERVSLSFLPHVSFSWECQTVNYGKMNTTMLEVRVSFIFHMYGLIFKALKFLITMTWIKEI